MSDPFPRLATMEARGLGHRQNYCASVHSQLEIGERSLQSLEVSGLEDSRPVLAPPKLPPSGSEVSWLGEAAPAAASQANRLFLLRDMEFLLKKLY